MATNVAMSAIAIPACSQDDWRGPSRPWARGSREEAMATNFLVNGKAATTDAPPETPLLWVIPKI